MGDGVLLLGAELGEGLFLLRHEEDGVVAEAVLPLGGVGQGAGALPPGGDNIPIGHAQGDDRDEFALPVQLPLHVLQQQAVPAHVVQALPAVPGGVDSGGTVQSVHGQAGVVGDGGEAAGLHDGLGLQEGVLLEGGPRLLHVHVHAHVGLQDHLHPLGGEDVPHLHQLVLVLAGKHYFHGSALQRLGLEGHDLPDALGAQVHQVPLLLDGEGPALAGALELHDAALAGHDTVEVHLGGGVLLIAQVQQELVVDDAGGDGGHRGDDRVLGQDALGHQLLHRQSQGHIAAGDAGGAGAAVPLEHVAVDVDGTLPQLLHVHRSPEGTAHQALDLRRPGGELQLGDVPLGPLPVGPGQHGVLRSDPALSLRDVGGRLFLHRGGAQHHGVAAADKAGALREFVEPGGDLNGPELIPGPSVDSRHIFDSSKIKAVWPILCDGLHQRLGEALGVEGPQVLDALTQTHILHGDLEGVGDGHGDAALGTAVQLGEDDARDAGGLPELLGLDEAVLSGGGVQHQQSLLGAAGELPVDDAGDLVELVHQVLLVVEPSGGVHQDDVAVPGLGGAHRVKDHRGGVGTFVLLDDLHPRPLGPDGELVGGGGPEGVAGAEEDLLPLSLQGGGQFADGGGLAHAVDPDEEDHRGAGGEVQALVSHCQHVLEHPAQTVPHLLLVLELLALHPALELLHRLEGGVHTHVGQDEGLLQLIVKVVVDGGEARKDVQLFDFVKKSHNFLPLISNFYHSKDSIPFLRPRSFSCRAVAAHSRGSARTARTGSQ